jgi:hypothetical protein
VPKADTLAFRIGNGSEFGLHKSVLRIINNPSEIHLWWCENQKMLLIGVADKSHPLSIHIPEYGFRNGRGTVFYNQILHQRLKKLIGCNSNFTLKLCGEYVPDLNMVAFRIPYAMEGGR